jgi:hypothetical protein
MSGGTGDVMGLKTAWRAVAARLLPHHATADNLLNRTHHYDSERYVVRQPARSGRCAGRW